MKGAIRTDDHFEPHPDLKKLYYAYLIIGTILIHLSWSIPASIMIFLNSEPFVFIMAMSLLFIPFIAIIAFILFWIPRFYSSLSYFLNDNDIIIERGVWWRHKSIVPYNRVTNIDVLQGPLSRKFGLGKISIQTAGFSAGSSSGSAKVAEAVILGIKNFEEVKDLVMAKVKRYRPMAIESEPEILAVEGLNIEILGELKKIRKLLEKG